MRNKPQKFYHLETTNKGDNIKILTKPIACLLLAVNMVETVQRTCLWIISN